MLRVAVRVQLRHRSGRLLGHHRPSPELSGKATTRPRKAASGLAERAQVVLPPSWRTQRIAVAVSTHALTLLYDM